MDSTSTSKKNKKGIGRLWSKIKLAIRPKSKTQPISGTTESAKTETSHTQPIQRSQPMEPINTPIQTTAGPAESLAPVVSTMQTQEHSSTEPQVESGQSDRSPTSPEKEELARRYERAQAIFKKYNVEFDEAGWEFRPKAQSERVYKAPRIRVRWTCHECRTTFGHDKICVECAHQRCRTCARYPPKKKKAKAAKKAALAAENEPAEEIRDGACHECQTPFAIGTQQCSNCHHMICERCLQEVLATIEQAEIQAVRAS